MLLGLSAAVWPCTDVLVTREPCVVSARTMDWGGSMFSKVVIRPRGMSRTAVGCPAGVQPLTWTSQYGSVTTRAFVDASTTDGLNERGLSASTLTLSVSTYAEAPSRPAVTPAQWAQVFLDTCGTVAEAVAEAEDFDVVPLHIPLAPDTKVHLVLRDATGDAALLEYLEGKLVLHHPLPSPAVTNDPPYTEMLARIAPALAEPPPPMPLGFDPVSRCARASLWARRLPSARSPEQAAAYAFDVIQTVCRPPGDRAVTLWTGVRDHTNLTFCYRTQNDPQVVTLRLADLDLSAGQPEQSLDMRADPLPAASARGPAPE
jgi:choloylglycine hydrolase